MAQHLDNATNPLRHSTNTKTVRGRLISGATALVALSFAVAMPTSAATPDLPQTSPDQSTADTVQPITMVYEFYGAGFHLATLEAKATLTEDTYEISTSGQSSGVADSILRAKFESHAVGSLSGNGPTPISFRNFSDTRFGIRELEMTREADGTFDVTAEPELEPNQAAALRSGLADGTVDPLTASLYSALRPANTTCTEKVKVFDGRRVFNLAFSRKGSELLNPEDDTYYSGNALKCNLRYVPLAGQTREWKLEQARNPSPPVELWMAEFERPNKAGDVIIPVRMKVVSQWGTAMAHLTSVTMGNKPMIQASFQPQK